MWKRDVHAQANRDDSYFIPFPLQVYPSVEVLRSRLPLKEGFMTPVCSDQSHVLEKDVCTAHMKMVHYPRTSNKQIN